jgi:hypothetical protein
VIPLARAAIRSGVPRAFRRAERYLRERQIDPLELGLPWMPTGAINAIARLAKRSSRVFEYGSGGSTIFLANRVRELVTVEHDPEWYARMQAGVSGRRNVRLRLVEPGPAPPDAAFEEVRHYTSTDEHYRGMWFRDYVRTIEEFEPGHFDGIVVDGRARVGAFIHGARQLRPGGWIVLDDSEREIYREVFDWVGTWPHRHYRARKPNLPFESQTTIWTKPADAGHRLAEYGAGGDLTLRDARLGGERR